MMLPSLDQVFGMARNVLENMSTTQVIVVTAVGWGFVWVRAMR
jgi:hypothetical protein